jgi:hypothetical protein
MAITGLKNTALWRIVREVRLYWPHLRGIFVLSLVSAPLALLAPLPLKIVADNVLGSQDLPNLLSALLPRFADDSRGWLLAAALDWQLAIICFGLYPLLFLLTRRFSGGSGRAGE